MAPVNRSRSRGRSMARTPSRTRAMDISPVSKKWLMSARKRGVFTPRGKNVRPAYKKRRIRKDITGQIGPRFKKGTRKAANYLAKYLYKGISITFEYSGSTTSTRCVFLGHSTINPNQVKEIIGMAAAKMLLLGAKVLVPSQPDQPFGVRYDGWSIRMGHSDDSTSTAITDGLVTNIGITSTLQTLGSAFTASLFPLDFDDVHRTVKYFELVDSNSHVVHRVMMNEARINLHIASNLKVQNRTQSVGTEGANQTTTITSNPLIGRVYSGNGMGTDWKGNGPINTNGPVDFYVNQTTGMIDLGLTTENSLQEPPLPKEFTHVSHSSGYSMKPGEIKTSYLKQKISVSFDKFCSYLRVSAGYNRANGGVNRRYGKFRMIGLEKLMEVAVAEPDTTVGFENDYKIHCYITPGRQTVTTSLFSDQYKV